MSRPVKKVRVTEADMTSANSNLLPNVRQHDFFWYNEKSPLVYRHNWAVPAKVLAATASLCVARCNLFAVSFLQIGIIR